MNCKTCGQSVGTFSAITHMMGIHESGKNKYRCGECGASFDNKKDLAAHEKTHM